MTLSSSMCTLKRADPDLGPRWGRGRMTFASQTQPNLTNVAAGQTPHPPSNTKHHWFKNA